MRKSIAALMLVACFSFKAKAQDNMMFNHMSVGLSLSLLDGVGFEVAAPIGEYVNVRTGFSFLPKVHYDVNGNKVWKEIAPDSYVENGDADARVNFKKSDWKLLFDIHPFKTSSFRFTLGAFVGNSEPFDAYNTKIYPEYANCFIKLSDYCIGFDEEGNTKAKIKVNSFRPYLGIGFGRALSADKKFAFNFDLGVQFWGSPKVYGYDVWDKEMKNITAKDVEVGEAKDALNIISKISVSPTLSMRFVYNIF